MGTWAGKGVEEAGRRSEGGTRGEASGSMYGDVGERAVKVTFFFFTGFSFASRFTGLRGVFFAGGGGSTSSPFPVPSPSSMFALLNKRSRFSSSSRSRDLRCGFSGLGPISSFPAPLPSSAFPFLNNRSMRDGLRAVNSSCLASSISSVDIWAIRDLFSSSMSRRASSNSVC